MNFTRLLCLSRLFGSLPRIQPFSQVEFFCPPIAGCRVASHTLFYGINLPQSKLETCPRRCRFCSHRFDFGADRCGSLCKQVHEDAQRFSLRSFGEQGPTLFFQDADRALKVRDVSFFPSTQKIKSREDTAQSVVPTHHSFDSHRENMTMNTLNADFEIAKKSHVPPLRIKGIDTK